mgnify:CR=1 FL=1
MTSHAKKVSKDTAQQRIYRAKWREEGRCSACGRGREDEKYKMCKTCRDQRNKLQTKLHRRVRKSRNALGLCHYVYCLGVAMEGSVWGGYHHEQHQVNDNVRRQRLIAAGKCTCGGEPIEGKRKCLRCTTSNKKRWDRIRSLRVERGTNERTND